MKSYMNYFYRVYGKRFLDLVIASIGILFLWPVMIIIALIIKCDSQGSILFKQKRLGKNLRPFIIYKFRTMVPDAYALGGAHTYDGDPRITKIGSILRKSSLDELPQLFNVLKGEMSIIGPRPLLEERLQEYENNKYYRKRSEVVPGMFCLVDLKYREAASKALQFKLDAEYVKHLSFLTDSKIFFGIIKTVLKQENIYSSSQLDEPVEAKNTSESNVKIEEEK